MKKMKSLSLEERKYLESVKDSSMKQVEIAKHINRTQSIVSLEYNRNGGRQNYNANDAHCGYHNRRTGSTYKNTIHDGTPRELKIRQMIEEGSSISTIMRLCAVSVQCLDIYMAKKGLGIKSQVHTNEKNLIERIETLEEQFKLIIDLFKEIKQ